MRDSRYGPLDARKLTRQNNSLNMNLCVQLQHSFGQETLFLSQETDVFQYIPPAKGCFLLLTLLSQASVQRGCGGGAEYQGKAQYGSNRLEIG